MRIFRAIVISSLSIPALIFLVFLGIGIVFLGVELTHSGKYSNGWLGLVYAGLMYAYFSAFLSTIPTIVFGLPMSLVADRYGLTNRKVVLIGGAITGGLFLDVAATLLFETGGIELFLWAMLAGSIGGLLNGYVFLKYTKPNPSFHPSGFAAG